MATFQEGNQSYMVFPGNMVDFQLSKGELHMGTKLVEDKWVVATVAICKPGSDQMLIHVSGGKSYWVPKNSNLILPSGSCSVARPVSPEEKMLQEIEEHYNNDDISNTAIGKRKYQ